MSLLTCMVKKEVCFFYASGRIKIKKKVFFLSSCSSDCLTDNFLVIFLPESIPPISFIHAATFLIPPLIGMNIIHFFSFSQLNTLLPPSHICKSSIV